MRKTWPTLLLVTLIVLLALPAMGASTKYTFEDVTLPNGDTGEITASTKISKNKPDSVYCGYFSDDWEESLGYYFNFYEPAPTDPDVVLEICLDNFDERST